MKAQNFILDKLASLKTPDDIQQEPDLADTIYKLVMSKKFRKYSVNPEYQEHIKSAIKENIKKNEPIKFTLVFGGYKLWRLDESPEVDWAELFSIIYYAKWIKPIAAIYKPGVWFDFFSDDVILRTIDNIPPEDTERYIASFKRLLVFIKPLLPKNINFTLNRVADQYKSYDDFKKDLDKSLETLKRDLDGKLPKLTDEQIGTLELNVKLTLDQKNDKQWREKVQLLHDAYAKVSGRRPYYRTSDKLMIITRPIPDSIAVGTTKRSVMKFWIGAGVLERTEDGFAENIYSPGQLAAHEITKENVAINGLDGKNFKSIKIST